MIITLCSGAKFFDCLIPIKNALKSRGYNVLLTSMVDYHHLEETALFKIQHDLIRDHFRKIDVSDAIYVANCDSKGIGGYIGGGCFMEMTKAFDKGIPIFLMKDVPNMISYREELLAMQPVVVGEDWDKLDRLLLEFYKKEK